MTAKHLEDGEYGPVENLEHPEDQDIIEELKASRKVVGELFPIVKDQHGRTISGSHREAAGFKTKVVRSVQDDAEFFRLKLHFNVQRKVSEMELVRLVANYALALEKKGLTGAEIVQEICRSSGYGAAYVRVLIPKKYLKPHHQTKVGQDAPFIAPTPDHNMRWTEKNPDFDQYARFAHDRFETCPNCNSRLIIKPRTGVELSR